jgi:hypothetical protein
MTRNPHKLSLYYNVDARRPSLIRASRRGSFHALNGNRTRACALVHLQVLLHRCNRIFYYKIANNTTLQPLGSFAAYGNSEFMRPAEGFTECDCAATRVSKR